MQNQIDEVLRQYKELDARVKAIEIARAEETGERKGRARTFGGMERLLGVALVLMTIANFVQALVHH